MYCTELKPEYFSPNLKGQGFNSTANPYILSHDGDYGGGGGGATS